MTNQTINKIENDVEELGTLLSFVGYFKTNKGVFYKFKNNNLIELDSERFKEVIEDNVFLYGVNPERFIPILKENIGTLSNYEFNLLSNSNNLPVLNGTFKEIRANKEKDSDFIPDSLKSIGVLLKNEGFFLIGTSNNSIYRYDEGRIEKYELKGLRKYLSESKGLPDSSLDIAFNSNNFNFIVNDIPKVREQDFRLWNTILDNDSTIAKAIEDLNRIRNRINY